MMYLKIMSGENLPDGNTSKAFQLIECESGKTIASFAYSYCP